MLKVRKASYNDIDFNVQSTDVAGGHKQSEHQFNNNKTGLQQHGVKNRTYTLSALHFGVDSVKQANNLIDQLEKSGAGVLMHPDYGELVVGFDTFSTGVNTKRNMVVTKLGFLQDSDVNLLSVDYQGLLVETIAQTALQVINSTLSAITTSNGKFEAIIDFKSHINNDIELDNMDVILGHVLESAPLAHTSNNPITQTFSQQHQTLFVATNSIDKLKHQLGSEVGELSTSIHPLFSDNEVQYVS
jgi:prophage DNA circulation protein